MNSANASIDQTKLSGSIKAKGRIGNWLLLHLLFAKRDGAAAARSEAARLARIDGCSDGHRLAPKNGPCQDCVAWRLQAPGLALRVQWNPRMASGGLAIALWADLMQRYAFNAVVEEGMSRR